MVRNLGFYIGHSLNDLQVNRRRTLFALLCIAAGVAAIVSLQTLGEMISATLTGSLQESNKGDIHIFSGPGVDVPEDVQQRGRDEGVIEAGGLFFPDYFGEEGVGIIEDWFADQSPHPATLTIQQTFSDLTTGSAVSNPANNKEQTFISVFIVDAQRYPLYGQRESVDGISLRDLLRQPNDIVLSEKLADKLDVDTGDMVRVAGASVDFMVSSIVPDDAEAGLANISASMFGYYYLDLSAAQFFTQKPATYDIYVRLDNSDHTQAVNSALENAFPYVTTTTTNDLAESNSQVADVLNDLVTIMGLISLMIGGIGIVNTMLVIVSRRTLEVAVLKTVGLEPHAVSVLFLVEALLMGLIGSVMGVVLGWGLALALKSIAENFLAQPLVFRITIHPAITGLVVGVVITAIFGMLPTLAAGRIRPGLVLRPSDTIVPRAGRLLSFLALLMMLITITLVVRGLVGNLLDSSLLRSIAGILGAILGFLAGLAIALSSLSSREPIIRRIARWVFGLVALPLAGYGFGSAVPALLLVTGAAIQVAFLYAILWLLIWAMGGGSISINAFLMKLPPLARLAALPFLALLPVLIWPILLLWGLGRLIQHIGFVDLKIAMRSMLAAKGRGATTLLALVVGVFTLSLITMLVDSITNQFQSLLEREAGGNVFVFAPGQGSTAQQIEEVLAVQPGVKSSAIVTSYDVELVSAEDGQTGERRSYAELKDAVQTENEAMASLFEFSFQAIDARELDSNLPDVKFYRGRQLAPLDAGQPVIIIDASQATLAAGLDVGDQLTFDLTDSPDTQLTLEIVGMVDRRSGSLQMGTTIYAPKDAFPPDTSPTQITAVVDIDETQMDALRDALESVPGTFVLETRFLNEVINRVINQFTTFPILVAALALFTGGIVIANSVALSTMERRREIGIMKAIGLQRERVLGMLLLENALMGFIGGLIGVGTGVMILLSLLVGVFQGRLSDAIPLGTAFLLMGLCIGIALIAAVFSVWGASGEKPLNVLRYE